MIGKMDLIFFLNAHNNILGYGSRSILLRDYDSHENVIKTEKIR